MQSERVEEAEVIKIALEEEAEGIKIALEEADEVLKLALDEAWKAIKAEASALDRIKILSGIEGILAHKAEVGRRVFPPEKKKNHNCVDICWTKDDLALLRARKNLAVK